MCIHLKNTKAPSPSACYLMLMLDSSLLWFLYWNAVVKATAVAPIQTPSFFVPVDIPVGLPLKSYLTATRRVFQLQRACRGMLGRRRAGARRSMIAAAGKALQWVSLKSLQPKHLKELENAIRGALVDPLVRNRS